MNLVFNFPILSSSNSQFISLSIFSVCLNESSTRLRTFTSDSTASPCITNGLLFAEIKTRFAAHSQFLDIRHRRRIFPRRNRIRSTFRAHASRIDRLLRHVAGPSGKRAKTSMFHTPWACWPLAPDSRQAHTWSTNRHPIDKSGSRRRFLDQKGNYLDWVLQFALGTIGSTENGSTSTMAFLCINSSNRNSAKSSRLPN